MGKCIAANLGSTDVLTMCSLVPLNNLKTTAENIRESALLTNGETGFVTLTGVSISLNEVSGWSAMGTAAAKTTAAIKGRTQIHLLRFVTKAPKCK
jgi:hypothetical protein